MSRPRHRQVRLSASCLAVALLLAVLCCLTSRPTFAASATWNGTTNSTWSTSTNWTAGGPPGTGNTATFNNAGNGNTTISLSGIIVNTILFDTSSAAAYTMGSGGVGNQTLTLNDSGAITINSGVTANQLFNANLVLGTNGAAASYTFTNNSSTAGELLTIAGAVSGGQTNNQHNTKTLTLAGSNNGLISGVISGNGTGNGSNALPVLAVTKSGTGTWTLSGANTYSGATTINAGTLKLDNNNTTTARLANTSGIAVNSGGTLLLAQTGVASTNRINDAAGVTISGGGTFATGGLSEGTRPTNSGATNGAAGMGALTLQSTSSVSRAMIDFLTGANGSTLAFSSLVGGNGAFLDIKNWTGTPFTDDSATGNDRLLFGIDPGLTAAQLANVRFFDDSGAFIGAGEIIGYGNMFELVAVPEPSTWLAAALALGAIGFSQRKRLRACASSAVEKHS